ncbi:MAG: right-handed parallel beta-helix repeat-containing protein, partial [Acidobacteria bacterium]|nr:right-handed parallel beta-helix repeat-containing protein [Acidobacteriota bacterium]
MVFTLALSALTQAQATRTWVSGVGDDVNPCSRTAPCKTFAGAISKTAANGEISVLDPGGYGTLTITKSITVDGGTGAGWASTLASLTNGFIINDAANTIVVHLRNISINGSDNGTDGIRFLAGKALYVENCRIFRFAGDGIDMSTSTLAQLYVKDTVISECVGDGIKLTSNLAGQFNTAVLE